MSRRAKVWYTLCVLLVLGAAAFCWWSMSDSWTMSDEQREACTVDLLKELARQAPRPWWKHDKFIEWGWVDEYRSTDAIVADLAHIESQVAELYLGLTGITDAGLVHLKELKQLKTLYLSDTGITNTGLIHLKDLRQLQTLYLAGTDITDAGLVHLKELKQLQELNLSRTKITDAGLAHLKELKQLRTLHLFGTQITDAGLIHLKELKQLQTLDLEDTQITDAGVKKLRAALPKCEISK